jgi:hypothetical protein
MGMKSRSFLFHGTAYHWLEDGRVAYYQALTPNAVTVMGKENGLFHLAQIVRNYVEKYEPEKLVNTEYTLPEVFFE